MYGQFVREMSELTDENEQELTELKKLTLKLKRKPCSVPCINRQIDQTM